MKYIGLIVILTNLYGCAFYAFLIGDEYSTLEKLNAGLLDTLKIDSTKWENDYNNYVKELNPQNRNYNNINEILHKNEEVILDCSN
jgi:hypothetical protein